VEVDIRPGMSFVEVMYTRLGIDPVEGLTILDALDIETLNEAPAQSLIITQVYSQPIASDAKLMLMDLYPDEYEITYIHNLAMADESIRQIPLYELDRQPDLDHLTSLYIRPLAAKKG
jgi:tetrapyrrole methylase family protein/MazG family protein